MKSLVEFIQESQDNPQSEFIYVVYDDDGTIINVFDTEIEAKDASEEHNKAIEGNKSVVKKETRSSIMNQ